MFFSNPTAFDIFIVNSNCHVSNKLLWLQVNQSTCMCLLFLFLFQKAFSKKKVNDRKDWLTRAMDDRKWRRQQGLSEVSYVRRNSVDGNHWHKELNEYLCYLWQFPNLKRCLSFLKISLQNCNDVSFNCWGRGLKSNHLINFFLAGLLVWEGHKVSFVHWFCQQGTYFVFKCWQWTINSMLGWW